MHGVAEGERSLELRNGTLGIACLKKARCESPERNWQVLVDTRSSETFRGVQHVAKEIRRARKVTGFHPRVGLRERALPTHDWIVLGAAGKGAEELGVAARFSEVLGDPDETLRVALKGGRIAAHLFRHLLPGAEVLEHRRFVFGRELLQRALVTARYGVEKDFLHLLRQDRGSRRSRHRLATAWRATAKSNFTPEYRGSSQTLRAHDARLGAATIDAATEVA